MTKYLFLFILMGFSSLAFAQAPVVKVIDSQGDRPSWIEEGDATGMLNGKKVIFFNGVGESKSKSTAKEAAELNARTYAAAAIKSLATKEVARAWESLGIGDNEQKEQVIKGFESISAKNVNVSGTIKTAVWWRLVVKPVVDKKGKQTGWSQPIYEYYVRYALDYSVYLERRDAVINEVKKNKPQPKKEEVKKEEPEKQEVENKEEPKDEYQEEIQIKKEEPKKKKGPIRMKARTEENTDEYDSE